MSSIIEGYKYDIFISYRQKDNKHDGWVTEFVNNLKGELESTFKEEISVYFDVNPHDGLLETHDVSESLKEKLRCLIFIPIISRTYCDPRSFAWEHEFKAFIELASKDQYGLKVKLPNGNVAGRVLPVRIHELDSEDSSMIEDELGGFIRGIEFVYEEQGVNRPLRADDDRTARNLNKVIYRNQINKTANAIKEILSGIKARSKSESALNAKTVNIEEPVQPDRQSSGKKRNKVLIFSLALIPFVVVLILFFLSIFKGRNLEIPKDPDGKISIAVSNFDNLTGDSTLNSWSMGIAELLINNLGSSEELNIQSSRTMNELYQSMGQDENHPISASISREAARRLKAGNYISGSFQRSGNLIRIVAKLADTENDNILWTGRVDGDINHDYMVLVDSISFLLKDFLEIKALEKNVTRDFQSSYTKSADAFRKYIGGTRLFMAEDYTGAISLFQDAFRIDSTFAMAAFYIANASNIISISNADSTYWNQSVKWTEIAYRLREGLPSDYQLWIEMWNAFLITFKANDVLKYCALLEKSDLKSRYYWYDIAVTYLTSFEMWGKAANAFSRIETINSEWEEDWKFSNFYRYYGYALHKLDNHEKEAEIYKKGLSFFPDNWYLLFGQATCSLNRGKFEEAGVLIDKMLKIARDNGISERFIERNLGLLYQDAGLLNEADQHFRESMRLYSSDAFSMYLVGDHLIRNDMGIDEGLNLIDNAITLDPGNFFYLRSKGVGLFKKGKYKDALETLQKAKSKYDGIRPDVDKEIQKVKDALADQL